MKTRICDACRFLKWDDYRHGHPITYRCTKGHKPRMYKSPDPWVGYEIKRKCADYREAKDIIEVNP